jgi:Na+/H+-dicarboxylate symporter
MVPLIFFALTTSISSLKKNNQSQRLWQGTIAFYLITMLTAIIIMMTAFNIFSPGTDSELLMNPAGVSGDETDKTSYSLSGVIQSLIQNPFKALASGNIMAVVIFSIFFGLSLRSSNKNIQNVRSLMSGLFDSIMQIVNWIMRFAPLGIFALLTDLIVKQDMAVFMELFYFIAIVIFVILFHGLVVLPFILKFFTKIKFMDFFIKGKEIFITAFATSSSAATLPITIKTLEKNYKIEPNVSKFVLPLGATINMDGTAMYEAAVALFVANIVGINLGFSDQVILVFIAMAASIGAPAIPSAGMVTLVIVLSTLNLPVEYIALFIPVDRLIDTFRTTINVEGDVVAALVMNRFIKKS